MDPTAVLLLGLLPVAVFVTWPLFSPPSGDDILPDIDGVTGALERDKHAALAAIKEAEFDQRTGKLSDEDYNALITRYRDQAMRAIAALESQAAAQPTSGPSAPDQKAPRMRFCPSCGTRANGKFCSGCGTPLS